MYLVTRLIFSPSVHPTPWLSSNVEEEMRPMQSRIISACRLGWSASHALLVRVMFTSPVLTSDASLRHKWWLFLLVRRVRSIFKLEEISVGANLPTVSSVTSSFMIQQKTRGFPGCVCLLLQDLWPFVTRNRAFTQKSTTHIRAACGGLGTPKNRAQEPTKGRPRQRTGPGQVRGPPQR